MSLLFQHVTCKNIICKSFTVLTNYFTWDVRKFINNSSIQVTTRLLFTAIHKKVHMPLKIKIHDSFIRTSFTTELYMTYRVIESKANNYKILSNMLVILLCWHPRFLPYDLIFGFVWDKCSGLSPNFNKVQLTLNALIIVFCEKEWIKRGWWKLSLLILFTKFFFKHSSTTSRASVETWFCNAGK